MLNRTRHQVVMGRMLQDIYADTALAAKLGFKGGTCALFFYQLPRFSVDLDFDLLDESATPEMHNELLAKLTAIAQKYGTVKDSYVKQLTIFVLLSYGNDDQNIKVEVSLRQPIPDLRSCYEPHEYLGKPLLAGKKDYLFASKLCALTTRKKITMRDVFDIHYFVEQNWDVQESIIVARMGKDLKTYLSDCISTIERIQENEILAGLGELIDEKQKVWVRQHLVDETVFLLKNYQSALLRTT